MFCSFYTDNIEDLLSFLELCFKNPPNYQNAMKDSENFSSTNVLLQVTNSYFIRNHI